MAFHEYPDGNGDTIRLYEDDGHITHEKNPHWFTLSRLTSREDDVLLCAYLKSGTHWLWEIIHMLQTGTSELTSLDMKTYNLAVADPKDIESMPSPRVLATHRQFHDLPTDFILNKRKLVLAVRDPRDVCVSYYHFCKSLTIVEYEGKFDGFIKLFLDGKVPMNSWSRWILSFEKGLKEHPELPYHVVYFEKLKEDPLREIRRLAEFLDLDTSLATTVAEKTDFSSMQKYKTQFDIESMKQIFKGNKSNEHIFRKGTTGGWKDAFNEQQLAHFRNTLCEQLGRSSIQPFQL